MDKSKFMSRIIGLYFVIITTAMFVNMGQFMTNVKNLSHEPSIMFLSGFFTLILGLIMVVSHNVWKWDWRVVVTIISWMVLLKGISIIFFPPEVDKFTTSFLEHMNTAYIAASVDFILGLFLCYMGFRK